MAITALPQATIHLLGSAQALTTPTSLVKELVDNALDAKATSIDILISPNTIDKVEVRDNGHGILEADLDALGRRGHTSKLRSFDELKSIGGVTLGFRGEALASAVQLGEVSVTTKTEGEAVATCVKLKAPGGITSQTRVSHPIGTTVSVSNFLYALPVRKQTAEKEASKTLKKVKELLQSYALARPRIRFGLKVTKAGKGSWSFSPRPNDGMKEAVAQVIGRDAAAQCIEKSLAFSEKIARSGMSENNAECTEIIDLIGQDSNKFVVEAFVPKPNVVTFGHGQYISIDSRPVAHDKGTMRKIVTLFKYYLKGSVLNGGERLRDPFFRLDIRCPVASYDPNVEPAKDDILFSNEYLVLNSIEQLFKDVYGEPEATLTSATPEDLIEAPHNFELLMSRSNTTSALRFEPSKLELAQPLTSPVVGGLASPSSGPESREVEDIVPLDHKAAEELGRKWSVDMSKDHIEDVEGFQRPNTQSRNMVPLQDHDSNTAASPGSTLNPWTIAKLTAPVLPQKYYPAMSTTRSSKAPGQSQNHLPTPQQSSDPRPIDSDFLGPLSPSRPRKTFQRDGIRALALPSMHTSSHEPRRDSDDQLDENHLSRRPLTGESDDGLLLGDDSEIFRCRNDFNSARIVLHSSMPTITLHNGPKKSSGVHRPFVPPLSTTETAIPQDGLRQTTLSTGFQTTSSRGGRQCRDRGSNPDLAWAMDFEHRKEDATRERRKEILAAFAEAEITVPNQKRRRLDEVGLSRLDPDLVGDTVRSTPHKNRYNAAISNLEASRQGSHSIELAKPSFETSLPDSYPRAYLMKLQESMQSYVKKPGDPLKPIRAKSTRLPLERIPEREKIHTLKLKYPVSIGVIQNSLMELKNFDVYILHGIQFTGLVMNPTEAESAERRVQAIVENWRGTEEGQKSEAGYTFENLIDVN